MNIDSKFKEIILDIVNIMSTNAPVSLDSFTEEVKSRLPENIKFLATKQRVSTKVKEIYYTCLAEEIPVKVSIHTGKNGGVWKGEGPRTNKKVKEESDDFVDVVFRLAMKGPDKIAESLDGTVRKSILAFKMLGMSDEGIKKMFLKSFDRANFEANKVDAECGIRFPEKA